MSNIGRAYMSALEGALIALAIVFTTFAVALILAAIADMILELGWGLAWQDALAGIGVLIFCNLVVYLCWRLHRLFRSSNL